jgi:chromosome segregation ATPase
MASQPNVLDHSQLQSLVGWLEEQHRQDREELARLGTELDRLTTTLREQANELGNLRATVDHGQTTLERVPLVDESVRQAREHLADLLARFDEHTQKAAQTLLLRAADAERDRKVLNDLIHTVARLEHDDQTLAARVQVVADEGRRVGAAAAEVPKALESLESRISAFTHRAEQIEEASRRLDAAAQLQRQELEAIRTEQARAAQWRQLTDLRWTRQVSEWQTAIDNWRQAAEEHSRPVQHLIQQVGQARDEVRSAQGQIGEQARRLDDVAATATRLDNTLAQHREALARIEQVLDAQRRRFDEQASAQLRLDESVGRVTEQRAATERSIEEQTRQLDELRTALRLTDAELARTRQELVEGHTAIRGDSETIRGLANQALVRLDEAARSVEARFAELSHLLQSHRQRAVIELEQEMRELGDLAARSRQD